MGTYLLTWNPRRSKNEGLEDAVLKLQRRGRVKDWSWSSGNNKHIEVGDRVFLLRQGHALPGIVGSGRVSKGSFKAPSWEFKKRKRGIKAWYVLIEWDALVLPEKALSRVQLLKGILPATLINSAASGVTIEQTLADNLERKWASHRKSPLKVSQIVLSAVMANEGEPIEHRGYRRKRDQRLRRLALDTAAGVCAVCVKDYTKVLEGRGVRVLQVHHKKQLSQLDEPRLNKVSDLAVVCANCHALIHLNTKKALNITALKRMLNNQK